MSEVKLNLTDAQHTIHGTIHGSIADRAVAALSAEPETIAELEAALARYIRPDAGISPFAWFRTSKEIDDLPWDAGIVVIDLAARIVAAESTYSHPRPNGQVDYHDGVCATDIPVLYRVPDDWVFLYSIAEYEGLRSGRLQERLAAPLDARAILYGRPLLEFISREVAQTSVCESQDQNESWHRQISEIHIRWLMTPREDLRGQSPREVMLEKQDLIDYDLHTRSLQWSLQGEGPPCLAADSFAYRFAGFGTHEWVIYYDLVRHLLWRAFENIRQTSDRRERQVIDKLEFVEHQSVVNGIETEIACLEPVKTNWLEQPQRDYGGRIPALLIESERKRLPIAMLGRDMVIDEDCPVCLMMGAETGLGLEVGFWHLDGCNMDDDFAFSHFRTRNEWEAERREWEAFSEKFNREWEERRQRIARGEQVDSDPFFDSELSINLELSDSGEALGSESEDVTDRGSDPIQ